MINNSGAGSTSTQTVCSVPIAGGAASELGVVTDGTGEIDVDLEISPDGAYVVDWGGLTGRLFRVALSGGPAVELGRISSFGSIEISENSQYVVFDGEDLNAVEN